MKTLIAIAFILLSTASKAQTMFKRMVEHKANGDSCVYRAVYQAPGPCEAYLMTNAVLEKEQAVSRTSAYEWKRVQVYEWVPQGRGLLKKVPEGCKTKVALIGVHYIDCVDDRGRTLPSVDP